MMTEKCITFLAMQEKEQVTEGQSQKVCHNTYRYRIKYLSSGCKKAEKTMKQVFTMHKR